MMNRNYFGINNPFYGKKHTEETKRKLSEVHKGKPSWNKDKKCPKTSKTLMGHEVLETTREKLRRARLEQKDPRLGRKDSLETRKKLSESHKGLKPAITGRTMEDFYGKEKASKIKAQIIETLRTKYAKGEIKAKQGGLWHQNLVKLFTELFRDGFKVEIEKSVSAGKIGFIIDILINDKTCYEIGDCSQEKIAELITNGFDVIHLPYSFFEEG